MIALCKCMCTMVPSMYLKSFSKKKPYKYGERRKPIKAFVLLNLLFLCNDEGSDSTESVDITICSSHSCSYCMNQSKVSLAY